VTPLYPQKLALTSPTSGGRSVGIVRSRTQATEFFSVFWDVTPCSLVDRNPRDICLRDKTVNQALRKRNVRNVGRVKARI
jgi:hypothetical protein